MQEQPIPPFIKHLFIVTILLAALLGMAGAARAQQTFFLDTLAGPGWPYPQDLTSVAVASDGTIYLADLGSHTVLRVETHGRLSVFAGTGVAGFSGDGDAAAAAQLNGPTGVALTADDGAVYIADRGNHRIRKVDVATRIITTVAGTESAGFSGDGGPAAAAAFNRPSDVAVASDGAVYIADRTNHRIRKIDPSGIITTVAGTGTSGNTGDTGPAADAQLNQPLGVALTSDGTLYIADTFNHRIRKVDPSGIITTVVGTGNQGFSGDDGPATAAQLNYPIGVAVASDGTLYIAGWGNRRVRKVATDGIITTVAGTGTSGSDGVPGPATRAQLNRPYGVAVDSRGNFYIAQGYGGHGWLLKVNTSGTITLVAGGWPRGFSGDGGPAKAARLSGPRGVAVDSQGNVYIADSNNHRIRIVDTSGIIYTFTSTDLEDLRDVAVDSQGNVYIAEHFDAQLPADRRSRIWKVATDGTITTFAGTGNQGFSGDGGPATAARLSGPRGVAVASDGTVYIAEFGNNRVRKVATDGIITTFAGTGAGGFSGDGGAATAAQINGPEHIAVDSSGNVYIADTFNHRIRKVDTNGIINTIAGSGSEGFSGDGGLATAAQLRRPRGVAVASDGTVYIADDNGRIRAVTTNGTISTIAGTGTGSPTPRPGPATAVRIDAPQGIAVSSTGAVYIPELFEARVSVLTTNGPPTVRDVSPTTQTGTPVTIDLPVSDPNDDPLTVTVSTPSNGMATVSDTTIDYTPNAGFTGVDTFTYTVSDGQGASATATVRVRVEAPPRGTGTVTGGDGSGGGGVSSHDDHGNTSWSASPLAPHGRAAGWLETPNDIDYFTFTAPYAGVLVVETRGALDTRGTVWDRADRVRADPALFTPLAVVASGGSGGAARTFQLTTHGAAGPVEVTVVTADHGGAGQNFRLSTRVAAGPVVIAVRGNGRQMGRYLLQIALVGGYLENPAPDSFQSGVGVLSGWVCEGAGVEIEIVAADGTVWHQDAAYGTERADTETLPSGEPLCGDTDNGFGVLFNWNRLGDGDYEVVARLNGLPIGHRDTVDGIEVSRATVTVTTLGEEFVEDVAGACVVEDFPTAGETVRLVWQEARQNFVITDGRPLPPFRSTGSIPLPGVLENPAPNTWQSGIGPLSGWVCEADTVTLTINGQAYPVLYGLERPDTLGPCGDTDNGFGTVVNWNALAHWEHEVVAEADGAVFDRATVWVLPLGTDFLEDVAGTCEVADFPAPGETVTLTWQEAQQNFVITGVE